MNTLTKIALISVLSSSLVAFEGITTESTFTADYMSNISGGVKQESTILGNLDLTAELDTKEAGLWDDGTFFTYILGNFNTNGDMTQYVGNFLVTSNIEAPEALKLYEFWYQHDFTDRLSILVGIHDYNSEFDVLEYAGLFLNDSFGTEPDISQVGPSVFPNTAVGLRVAYKPTEESYLLAAVYDGVAGDPNDDRKTSVEFNKGEGIFSAIEVGLVEGESYAKEYYKVGLGAWIHTAEVANFANVVDDFNNGVYFIGEKTLLHNSQSALGGFLQVGIADSKRNQINTYIGTGLNYKGLFIQRKDDILGLAVAHAITSSDYRSFVGTNSEKYETAIELTYQAQITDYSAIQPDLQYIVNPSMDKTIKNATVAGIRVAISF